MDESTRIIDVLVIGGGLAAAFAAIKAKENGAQRVVQVCKVDRCSGNSAFAKCDACLLPGG
jgi:succinate dehydrogenase/fumarate reductase flavoprotein subunit